MMNSIPCIQGGASPRLYAGDICAEASNTNVEMENQFATTPMSVFRPLYQQPNEEELHTSFEQAIGDRVLAVNKRLSRISAPLSGALPTTEPLQEEGIQLSKELHSLLMGAQQGMAKYPSLWGRGWRSSLSFIGLALILMMIGFDLMGLIVLHAR